MLIDTHMCYSGSSVHITKITCSFGFWINLLYQDIAIGQDLFQFERTP